MKKLALLAAFALGATLSDGPTWAQGGAGTPPLTPSGSRGLPLPGRLVLPDSRQSAGSRVRTDRARYAPGQTVHMTFIVTNTTKKTVNYDFPSGQHYDFSVHNTDGKEVWRWSKGRMFTESLTHLALPPGKSITFRGDWNGRDAQKKTVPPGRYTVSARLPFNNRPALTGGVVVGRATDPNNMGFPTRSPIDNGAVRQVDVRAPVSASTPIVIGAAGGR